jgi:hypothetical protein
MTSRGGASVGLRGELKFRAAVVATIRSMITCKFSSAVARRLG